MSNEELDDNKLRDDKNYQDKMRIFFFNEKNNNIKKSN